MRMEQTIPGLLAWYAAGKLVNGRAGEAGRVYMAVDSERNRTPRFLTDTRTSSESTYLIRFARDSEDLTRIKCFSYRGNLFHFSECCHMS